MQYFEVAPVARVAIGARGVIVARVVIGARVAIGARVVIGARVAIDARVVIGARVAIGAQMCAVEDYWIEVASRCSLGWVVSHQR